MVDGCRAEAVEADYRLAGSDRQCPACRMRRAAGFRSAPTPAVTRGPRTRMVITSSSCGARVTAGVDTWTPYANGHHQLVMRCAVTKPPGISAMSVPVCDGLLI